MQVVYLRGDCGKHWARERGKGIKSANGPRKSSHHPGSWLNPVGPLGDSGTSLRVVSTRDKVAGIFICQLQLSLVEAVLGPWGTRSLPGAPGMQAGV